MAPPPTHYAPNRIARSLAVPVRGLSYHVWQWGDASLIAPDRPALVLLHGWMDVGASFQFLVDALAADRFVLAPDWRGYGRTQRPGADCYWFPDYYADLDALLNHQLPGQAIDLVGHSMGGNVAMTYAGVRPARIRRLVNIEGFSMPPTDAAEAPVRLGRWLDALKDPPTLRAYPSAEAVAARLQQNNPRLAAHHAAWLAHHWAALGADGQYHLLSDPAHKIVNPVLHRAEETLATWRAITAPVLWMEGRQTRVLDLWAERYTRADIEQRIRQLRQVERAWIDDCGHMVHHDQPQQAAAAIEQFLDRP